MKRATSLDEIRQVLRPKPLQPEELEEFFVETSEARDSHSSRRREMANHLAEDGPAKILLFGHTGSGKSTELVKFQEEQASRYTFCQFSVVTEAQIGHATTEVVLILTCEAVARQLLADGCTVDDQIVQHVYDWFKDVVEIDEDTRSADLAVGAKVGLGDSLLSSLLGLAVSLKSDIKAGSQKLHRAVTKENKRLSELAARVDALVREAALCLHAKHGKELLLIVEDLDKCSIGEADALFLENPAPLANLPTKAILTAPMFLLYNPRANVLDQWFKNLTLPMIKVRDEDGDESVEGRRILREILDERLELDALATPEAVDLAIDKTGGVLRHLFRTLEVAADSAVQQIEKGREETRLSKPDVRYGLNRLKTDLLRNLSVLNLPKDFEGIEASDLYDRLLEIHRRHRAAPVVSDKVNLLLLQAHALLEYNGEGWHRVHPLIAEFLDSREAGA
jgi:hypothetical protein